VLRWYDSQMSGTQAVVVGEKGRIVIPAEIRARRNWTVGTEVVLMETPDGMLLTDRPTAIRLVRSRLAGHDLVGELIDQRRAEAAADDPAHLE
jgi:AbrB family looped-hinge helix DNA binding protein